MRLAVGYPWSSPFMFTAAAENMANLRAPEGVATRIFRGTGWCPARRHNHLCEQALDWGADLICIIGADQVHPEDMLQRLLNRFNEGYEVVSALVPARGYVSWQEMQPFQKMAWRFKSSATPVIKAYRGMDLDSDMIEVVQPNGQDMEQIHFIGSGVLMFHRDHLMTLKPPWFKETIDPVSFQRIANQDCVFVWRLQMEAHAKVWVDTTIEVKHLHVFEIDDTYSDRFSDWEVPGSGDPTICRYREARDDEDSSKGKGEVHGTSGHPVPDRAADR